MRTESIARLSAEGLEVLVIGGGIVGSGVVRDCAMRGLRAGLLEQHDFAEGTSSRSSRLLHGGLRYLEQGHVFLVREASLEKQIVQRIAPHLVRPLGFVFPAYRGQGRPLWQLRIGVKLYDLLCSGRNFLPSRGMSRQETLQQLPGLRADHLTGAAFYADALTNDARLVIDTLRSAARHSAVVLNYARFENAQYKDGHWLCEATDMESGEKFALRARSVVNATGPWADKIPHSSVKLRLSKGIHVVVEQQRMPVQSAVVITEGKRILFVIPWGKRVIIGTTDTDYVGRPEDVQVAASDVDYVLETLNSFFPDARINRRDIRSVWAGLRPLIADPHGAPSDISRAHQITSLKPGWWDVAGGKLTTYRLMAEQTVDKVLGEMKVRASACRTSKEPLLVDEEQQFSGIDPAPWSQAAVEHYVTNEWAVHLDDLLLRRGGWLYHDRLSPEQLAQAATWMQQVCGWSDQRRVQEIERANRTDQQLFSEIQ
jgi:glycerol-3-phosphate dehydrogenase